MPYELDDPPWRVFARRSGERQGRWYHYRYIAGKTKAWMFVTLFGSGGPYFGWRSEPQYLEAIEHPRNDPEAIVVIKAAKSAKGQSPLTKPPSTSK